MKILKDSSLTVHHASVTQAIMLIFKSLGMRCVPFLDQIVPYLLQVARRCGPGLRESLLQQFVLLTSIVHHNVAPFLPALFEIIRDYWSEHLEHILILVEEIAATATDAFWNYIPIVLPLLLSSLSVPKGFTKESILKQDSLSPPLSSLQKTLHCYNSLRGILRPHIHLIVPAICKLISQVKFSYFIFASRCHV
jgi:FKBP12-rapamycin complex-associated protein